MLFLKNELISTTSTIDEIPYYINPRILNTRTIIKRGNTSLPIINERGGSLVLSNRFPYTRAQNWKLQLTYTYKIKPVMHDDQYLMAPLNSNVGLFIWLESNGILHIKGTNTTETIFNVTTDYKFKTNSSVKLELSYNGSVYELKINEDKEYRVIWSLTSPKKLDNYNPIVFLNANNESQLYAPGNLKTNEVKFIADGEVYFSMSKLSDYDILNNHIHTNAFISDDLILSSSQDALKRNCEVDEQTLNLNATTTTAWEFRTKIKLKKTGATASILGYYSSLTDTPRIYMSTTTFVATIPSISFSTIATIPTATYVDGTDFWIKLGYDSTATYKYYLSYSLDGSTYTVLSRSTTTTKANNVTKFKLLSNAYDDPADFNASTMDLKETAWSVNGVDVFKADLGNNISVDPAEPHKIKTDMRFQVEIPSNANLITKTLYFSMYYINGVDLTKYKGMIVVDWGDGTNTKINPTLTSAPNVPDSTTGLYKLDHNYTAGTYIIRIYETDQPIIQTFSWTILNYHTNKPSITIKNIIEIHGEYIDYLSFNDVYKTISDPQEPTKLSYGVDNSLVFDTPNLTSVMNLFEENNDLVTVGPNIFTKCKKLENCNGLFRNCANLVEVPAVLFANCPNINLVEAMFEGSGISIVSPLLFRNQILIDSIDQLFKDCVNLKTVPPLLFENNINITIATEAFIGSSIEYIPDNLFETNTLLTTITSIFQDSQLKTIPATLFSNCPDLYRCDYAFNHCQITTIPTNLFDNNPNITRMQYMFADCPNLTVDVTNLFSTHDWSRIERLMMIFANTQVTGNAQNFIDMVTEVPRHIGGFFGCTTLNDYDTIPELWKLAPIDSETKLFLDLIPVYQPNTANLQYFNPMIRVKFSKLLGENTSFRVSYGDGEEEDLLFQDQDGYITLNHNLLQVSAAQENKIYRVTISEDYNYDTKTAITDISYANVSGSLASIDIRTVSGKEINTLYFGLNTPLTGDMLRITNQTLVHCSKLTNLEGFFKNRGNAQHISTLGPNVLQFIPKVTDMNNAFYNAYINGNIRSVFESYTTYNFRFITTPAQVNSMFRNSKITGANASDFLVFTNLFNAAVGASPNNCFTGSPNVSYAPVNWR